MHKLVRITTVPMSLNKLLEGQMKFMSNSFNVIAISSDEDNLKKVGLKEGVEVKHIEMTRRITPIKDFIALYKLCVFFFKHKPTIVHTHTPKAGLLGMLAAKITGVPVRLHTVAGLPLLETEGLKFKLLKRVEKLTYRCSTMVYPNSHGLYNIILEKGLASKTKLKVIGKGSSNGIDTSFFDPNGISKQEKDDLRNRLNVSADDFVFIFVGRVVKDKGINELVRAFKELNKNFKKTKLLIVGPFEDRLDPISQKSKKEISSNQDIISTGYKEDVRPYFSIAHVLVFPSYREGFPNVVMQAGAMGLPSIVSNINGCNEIISQQKNGVIIPTKNTDAIYQEMKCYITDTQKYNRQKLMAREIIKENYERSEMLHLLLQEYMRLV